MRRLFGCEECKKATENILIDEKDKKGLEFCDWECIMKYAIKKHNRKQPTVKEGGSQFKEEL